MTVTGTLAQSNPTLQRIYDHAFRHAGIANQLITAEYLDTAKSCLNLLLADLVTEERTLWVNDEILLGMRAGVPQVVTPDGTMEITHIIVRHATVTEGTLSGTSPTWFLTLDANEETEAQFIGVKVSAAGIYNLRVESSPDGVVWTTERDYAYEPLVINKWNWLEVIPDTQEVLYFRVSTTDAASFPVTNICVSVGTNEIPIDPMGEIDYHNLPRKREQGNVNSYWTDRQVDAPVVNLWKAPNEEHEDYHLSVRRKRQIKDVGAMSGRVEIPHRWVDTIIEALAWRLAMEIPDASKDWKELKALSDEKIARILPSETDNGDFTIIPNISVYTR